MNADKERHCMQVSVFLLLRNSPILDVMWYHMHHTCICYPLPTEIGLKNIAHNGRYSFSIIFLDNVNQLNGSKLNPKFQFLGLVWLEWTRGERKWANHQGNKRFSSPIRWKGGKTKMNRLHNEEQLKETQRINDKIFIRIKNNISPTVGIEPTATWLKVTRSTTELSRLC